MILRPIPLKRAIIFNEEVHRRLPKLQGGMWAISLLESGWLIGVSIVGKPTARLLDENCWRLQVLRCAVYPGFPNACSMLYGASAKAARAMGAKDLFTYIHHDEHGISLKASGWILDENFESSGGQWHRDSRPRGKTVEPDAKKRYWAPWSDYVKAHL